MDEADHRHLQGVSVNDRIRSRLVRGIAASIMMCALAACGTGTQQKQLDRSAADARRLAEIRYRGGATSFLEVLDSETRAFSAQLGLAQAELNERLALAQIYRALGGDW